MHLPDDTLRYILSFLLCSDSDEDISLIAYTSDPSEYRRHPFAIIPAPLEPNSEVAFLEGIPVFHGTPTVHHDGDTIVVGIDLVATTFYLLSRYDEYASKAPLDTHSRFLPDNSLLGANDLLREPVIDQYTDFIYRLLKRPKPARKSHIYLTHDIDTLVRYRRPRGLLGGLYRSLAKGTNPDPLRTVLRAQLDRNDDPAYTFPLLRRLDATVPDAEVIYFAKPDNVPFAHYDRPIYSHSSTDFQTLTDLPMGLHSLYATFDHPDTLPAQMASIQSLPNHNSYHRSHFLRILPPTEMHRYSDAGITDDFTLAYASQPGFRLGTTRPSRAIDPSTARLLPLTLHPLTIMDTTLIDKRYLGLPEAEALDLCLSMVDTVKKYNGDVTLLFHNLSFANPTIANIYSKLLQHL